MSLLTSRFNARPIEEQEVIMSTILKHSTKDWKSGRNISDIINKTYNFRVSLGEIGRRRIKLGLRFKAERKCPTCGIIFTTEKPQRIYCSNKCFHIAQRKNTKKRKVPIEAFCKQCSKSFLSSNGKRRFCSSECRNLYYRNNYHRYGYNDGHCLKYPLVTKECLYCKKEFQTRKTYQVCCSKKCRQAIEGEKKKVDILNNNIKTRHCKYCGNKFKSFRSFQLFCSIDCQHKWYYELKRPRITKECKQCHQPFKTTNALKLFCSSVCYRRYHQEIYDKEYWITHKKPQLMIKKKCRCCGKEFDATKINQNYCSKKCAQSFWQRGRRKNGLHRWLGEYYPEILEGWKNYHNRKT